MISVSPYSFVFLMLGCIVVGAGATLVVVLPMARSMRETNSQYQKQLGAFGTMWSSLYEFQEHENDRHRRVADDMERRFWAAARMANGDGRGKMKAMADEMLGQPSAPSGPPSGRARRRGALSGKDEVRIARNARMEAAGSPLSTLGSTDGESTATG